MKLELTKKQYEALMKMCEIGSSVYGILGDEVSEDYKKESDEIEELESYFLGLAEGFGCGSLAEKFKGKLIPSDAFSERMQEVMDDYDDETFWHGLETRLGKRDFERDMTVEERKEVEKTGWLSGRVFDLYDKWAQELEEYGVDRLEVVESPRENLLGKFLDKFWT